MTTINYSKAEKREILFKETNGHCMVCGRPRAEAENWSCAVILPPAPRCGIGPEEMAILCNDCAGQKHASKIPEYANSLPFKKRLKYWWNVNKAFILGRISSRKREKLMTEFHLLAGGKPLRKFEKQTSKHLALFNETNGCCIYCGRQLTTGRFTLDHIVPRYYGGRGYEENLVTACENCNVAKGNVPVHDYVSSFSYRQLRDYVNRVKTLESSGSLPKSKARRLLNFENAHTHRKRIRLFNRLYTFSVMVEEL